MPRRPPHIVAAALGFAPEAFLAAADSVLGAADPEALGLPDGYRAMLAAESDRRARTFRLCEGYLAPDTYAFAAGTRPESAAAHLVATQRERLAAAARRPPVRPGRPTRC